MIVPGISLHRSQHRRIPNHWGIGIDETGDHGVVVDEFGAKQNFCHLNRVFGTLRCSNRTHERLITVTHVGINHVEMPFIYRQINRLTNGSSGMVKLRTEVGEFDKITEVLNRRVTSSFLYISDEGRAVSRNQN